MGGDGGEREGGEGGEGGVHGYEDGKETDIPEQRVSDHSPPYCRQKRQLLMCATHTFTRALARKYRRATTPWAVSSPSERVQECR